MLYLMDCQSASPRLLCCPVPVQQASVENCSAVGTAFWLLGVSSRMIGVSKAEVLHLLLSWGLPGCPPPQELALLWTEWPVHPILVLLHLSAGWRTTWLTQCPWHVVHVLEQTHKPWRSQNQSLPTEHLSSSNVFREEGEEGSMWAVWCGELRGAARWKRLDKLQAPPSGWAGPVSCAVFVRGCAYILYLVRSEKAKLIQRMGVKVWHAEKSVI